MDVMSYVLDKSRPENSVHYGKTKRFEKAKEEYTSKPIDSKQIIKCVNEYLVAYGLKINVCSNVVKTDEISLDKFNRSTKETYGLNSEKDILWIKFTTSGHIGVVAVSNDVNFNMPNSKQEYDERKGGRWKYNTSGIIVHYLKEEVNSLLEWDSSFFLVFPLIGLSNGKKERHIIETGVGNYLISKGAPILDFYSHRI